MNLLRAICSWKANGFCFGLLLATLVSAQAEPFANIGVAAPSLNGQTLTAKIKSPPRPTLTITVPANSTALTEPDIIITGTASSKTNLTGVFCNLSSSPGVGTNWTGANSGDNWKNWWINVTLAPGTNFVQAYAVDQHGNYSKTNQLKLIYSAASGKLAGTTITVPSQDYQISFSAGTNGTFSDGVGVGTYSYRKTGPLTGKLSLHYTSPPAVVTNDAVILQYAGNTNGTFFDADDITITTNFILTTASNLAQSNSLYSAELKFASANGSNSSVMIFLTSPNVLTNGTLIVTSNPVNLTLDAPYPGNIGDRVRVSFNHYSLQSGIWVSNLPVSVTGTVIDIGATSNTVTVLLDVTVLGSHTEVFSPMANVPLNILTFYYTDYINVTNITTYGDGTFLIYSNYSPVGSLLKINRQNTNEFYVLTYTSATNSGTYSQESYATIGGSPTTDNGVFYIVQPPTITTQPVSATTTNGGTVTFTIAAAGTQPITYQWQTTNGTVLTDGMTPWGSMISGSTSNSLTINVSSTATNDIGAYEVVVVNDYGTQISSVVNLNITLVPVITSQPQNIILYSNETSAAFGVTAIGYQPLSYQWFSGTNQLSNGSLFTNGVDSAESVINFNNLSIQQISTTNFSAELFVVITNNFGSVTSRVASLSYSSTSGLIP
jgi:hypothetical protein